MHTIVFILSFLRLHLILSRIQKSEFNFSLAFSQSNTTVVSLLVSAICTGPYETLPSCPNCKADQYKADGKTPQAYFQYLPLIPWLCAMFFNSFYAKKMQYHSQHQHDPTKITDIFDGAHYRSLLETPCNLHSPTYSRLDSNIPHGLSKFQMESR